MRGMGTVRFSGYLERPEDEPSQLTVRADAILGYQPHVKVAGPGSPLAGIVYFNGTFRAVEDTHANHAAALDAMTRCTTQEA